MGVLVMACCLTSPSTGSAQLAAPQVTPDLQLRDGLTLLQRGALEPAIQAFERAAAGYDGRQDLLHHADARVFLAQAYRALGHYAKAAQNLELALGLAQSSGDRPRLVSIQTAIGQVYLDAGRTDAAADLLTESLRTSRDVGQSSLTAMVLNHLGTAHAAKDRHADALRAFTESRFLAEVAGLPSLAAASASNAGRAAMHLGRHREAAAWLDQVAPFYQAQPDSQDKANGLITLGVSLRELSERWPSPGAERDSHLLHAGEAFQEAAAVAQRLGESRALSYAWGHWGHLYEQDRRYDEALQLTRQAVMAAQRVQAPESLYRWHWQTGRILRAQDRSEDALTAYRQAAQTLQSIRSELGVGAGASRASFRDTGGPVFFELADLLLQQAASGPAGPQAQSLLREARDAVEQLKAAELRDYFRDDCVDALQARTTSLEAVTKTAAIIYPILFPDRLELLVSLPDGMQRIAVPVTRDALTEEVRAFRRKLEKRTTREYLPHGQKLYDWLIRPLEPMLGRQPIGTLVFVPDGPLRTIPLAALHDRKVFLIARYAIATTPGLNLTDPHPLPREHIKVLSAGLTEGVQGFPPLPSVRGELDTIERLFGSHPLLNQQFKTVALEAELKGKQFAIVHIASHGKFQAHVEDTFLLTFDDKLTMDRLSQVVGFFRFRDEPLELLTLSACETAAGDDRAALGLAGVAIKAGARSALATLWFINDEASSALVSEFYRQLLDATASKAVALQRAQLMLLKDPAYQHPGYWAPFLLLNNWL
jgi:CHAT domain-containing protein/Tfp pilus assembly protein PilF